MKKKKALSILLVIILMVAYCVVPAYASAEFEAADVIVYLYGVGGSDSNAGMSRNAAVATLEKAYEILLGAQGGLIATNADSVGVILLCGTVTVGGHFNINREFTHKGKVVITGKYAEENYTAKLQFSLGSEQAIQLGGPTEFDHIILNRIVTNAYTIYSVESLTMGRNVVNQYNGSATAKSASSSGMQGKCIVRGGYYDAAYTGDVVLDIRGGTYWFISGANATSGGVVNGDVEITVGGNAWAATVVPGTQSAACNIENSKVTIESGATIDSITASGDNGTIINSEILLKGGTVNGLLTTRSGKGGTVANFTLTTIGNVTVPDTSSVAAGTKNLVINGRAQSLALAVDWNTVKLTGSSQITLTGIYPANALLTVEYGSMLNLKAGDSLGSWNGCGVVRYGGVAYSNHTWDAATGLCTNCGITRYTVYVDGTVGVSGDGYAPGTAVLTLEQAYAKLLGGQNNSLLNDANAKGTIVFCGGVTMDGQHFNLSGLYQHIGKVTLTSVYEGVDYRATDAARLAIGSYNASTETRFQCGGPTIFDDITIHRLNQADGSAGTSLTIYGTTDLTMGEGVETTNTNWNRETFSEEVANTTKLSAHMGYIPVAPQNSIPAFVAAGEKGYWSIETDVRQTKDGQLVCSHDAAIDAMFNGSGTISNMTLSQLYQYKIDTGNNVNQYTDQELRIPLFSEYLEICQEYGALPFIEVKAGNLAAIINEAKRYFDEEDIIISSTDFSVLQQARALSDDVFIHHIFSTEDKIDALSNLGNGGMSFRYTATDLQNESTLATVRNLINTVHAANVQVCLRAGDDLHTVKTMLELGVDYIPTNTTTPENLRNPSYESYSGGKIFIRGGYAYKPTNEDITIHLLSGQYDFVAASNAEKAANGKYHVTVGGKAFVSRLVAGSTCNTSGTIEQSCVTVGDNAVVRELYTVGDYGTTTQTKVLLTGGLVEALANRRSGKTGSAVHASVTLQDEATMPASIDLRSNITGTKELVLRGITGARMSFDSFWTTIALRDGSEIILVGAFPAGVTLIVEPGSSLMPE